MCSILSRFEAPKVSLCLTAVAKRVACTFFKSSLFLATPLIPLCCLTDSPPHEPVFGANQLCGVLDETALSDVATCLLLAVPINDHDARSMSPHCGRLSSTSGVVSRAAKATRSRARRISILGVPSRRGRVVPAPSSRHRFATHSLATPAIGALLYYMLTAKLTNRSRASQQGE